MIEKDEILAKIGYVFEKVFKVSNKIDQRHLFEESSDLEINFQTRINKFCVKLEKVKK